jgi:hypothetical protein
VYDLCLLFVKVSGLQYVIINDPPALGVVHDAAGHERPEAIRKYQVGEKITEIQFL